MHSDVYVDAPHIEVVTAAAALAGGVAISIAHTLGRVSTENGYSWFGTQKATIVPYTLSMVAAAVLFGHASTLTDGATRLLLRLMAGSVRVPGGLPHRSRPVGVAQPSPRESCFSAVSTLSADATTSSRSGSSSGRWICTT